MDDLRTKQLLVSQFLAMLCLGRHYQPLLVDKATTEKRNDMIIAVVIKRSEDCFNQNAEAQQARLVTFSDTWGYRS